MGGAIGIGLSLIGLGIGVVIGWALGARRADALRREHASRRAEVRNHVLPLLEQRAIASGVPADRRAHDEHDALTASIELARAIREIEAHEDLPFTDTLEVSKHAIAAETERRRRA